MSEQTIITAIIVQDKNETSQRLPSNYIQKFVATLPMIVHIRGILLFFYVAELRYSLLKQKTVFFEK